MRQEPNAVHDPLAATSQALTRDSDGQTCIVSASAIYLIKHNARCVSLAMRIDGNKLTTCGVAANGESLHLDLVDKAGNPVSLSLPFDQARALTKMLPRLLTLALKARTGNDTARHVFALAKWRLEAAADSRLIVTIESPDGFEVAFCMPLQECWEFARALSADAEWAPDRREALIN